MDKHISLRPCPFCGMGLTLDIDEEGGVAILHSLKGEKNCWFPSIVEIEMPIGTTIDDLINKVNIRPIEDRLRKDITGYRRTVLQQGHLIMGLEEDNSNLSYEVHWRDKHIMELENAWLLDETVQKNGNLRPSISDTIHRYETQIAELEAENIHLLDALHNKTLQFDTIADLNNKYRTALNDIYKNGKDHDVEWCQHRTKEELSE